MTPRPWERPPSAELLSVVSGSSGAERRSSRPGGASLSSVTHQADVAEAVRSFIAANPILPFMQDRLGDVELRRVAATDGGEWAGPCVLCGGNDRFHVWPTPRTGSPRAWCRQCGASGDVLHWAVLIAGRDPSVPGSAARTLRDHGFLEPREDEHVRHARASATTTSSTPVSTAISATDGAAQVATTSADRVFTEEEIERRVHW